jgi:hypothetical protein
MGRDLEARDFFWPLAQPELLFLGIFTLQNMLPARPSPGPARKLRRDVSHSLYHSPSIPTDVSRYK